MPDKPIDTEFLWEEFSDHVRNFLRSRIPDDEKAEDVLQDIFLRIHRGLGNLKQEERVESWIFGIARRALADYYRQMGKDLDRRPAGRRVGGVPYDRGEQGLLRRGANLLLNGSTGTIQPGSGLPGAGSLNRFCSDHGPCY